MKEEGVFGDQRNPPNLQGGPWDLKGPLKPGRFPWGLRDLQNLRGVHTTGEVPQILGRSLKAWWQSLGLERDLLSLGRTL